jgi:branched-chain amino acid transport system substrate-binding protein
MRTRLVVIVALLVSILALSACQGGGNAVKVAILAPLSGNVATFGESTRDGAMLAIEEWNAQGGVLGREIEVVVEDSQCDAEAARSAANKVIDQDGVEFIIGEVCSSASIPVSEIAVAKDVFQISPTSTNPAVTIDEDGIAKPTVFRACFTDDWQGGSAAKYAIEELGAATAAVMVDQGNDYVLGLGEFFRDAFEAAGGSVVVFETYTVEDTDFSAILTNVKDAGPDVLYLPDYYSKVNLIAAQAQELAIDASLMGGDGWDSPDLDTEVVEGGYFSNHYSPSDPRPIVQDFVAKYEEEYGSTPDALATLAYDAVYILFMAMEEADSTDPVVVAETMETMEFEVVSGRIAYDAQHNPVKAAFILHVTGGQVELDTTLYPTE